MPPIPTSLPDRRMIERNRKLAAAIAAGHSPLDDQIVGTLAAQADALLDVPGPRVTQLLAELRAARARIAELEAANARLHEAYMSLRGISAAPPGKD